MNLPELPPLPYTTNIRNLQDDEWVYSTDNDFANPEKFGWERVYDDDQMRDYGAACFQAGLERAAQECDEREQANLYGTKECAAAIRALLQQECVSQHRMED
jgi:hypothetical protein